MKKYFRSGLRIGFLLVLLCFIESGCQKETEEFSLVQEEVFEKTEDIMEQEETEISKVYVDVAGAVQSPGVYILEEGSRVYQAIEAAGGLCEEACTENLNQARILSDGEKIRILTVEEAEGEGNQISEEMFLPKNDKINLNQATKEQLMELNGIGESKANAIISYRELHGRFQTIEEIMQIEGIKESTFSKIKDKIVIE